ncbi:DUF397 domain-containing protein [Streptomyces albidoflavus]
MTTRPTLAQLANAQWRTSTYSAANNECVEVALGATWVGVRDTKTPDGPALLLSGRTWTTALHAVSTGTI